MPAGHGAPSLAARSTHWLRRWLYTLNALLLACAIGLAFSTTSRLGALVVFIVPLTFLPFAYARLRLHRALAPLLERPGRRAMLLVAVSGVSMLFDAVMAAQLLTARSAASVPLLHGTVAAWIGPVWFSAHALLLLGYGLIGAGRGLDRAARWPLRRHRPAPASDPGDLVLGRREFIQQFGVVGAGAPFIVSLSSIQLSYDFRVEEHEIVLPSWPTHLDGLRVAHLSDIHVGGAMNRERLLHVAALTNEARPEIVLHTGDFLTHRGGDFDAPLYEALARIRAPLGQWACLGNHDFDAPDLLVRRLHDAGVETLRDRRLLLRVGGHPLEIAGLDFVFARAARGAAYARTLDAWPRHDGTARLVLSHDPSAFFSFPAACADLVLSGHMHGGQIGIQLGPAQALTLVRLLGMCDQGVYARGDLRMYVTRCVGFYGYPMRVGIPPEIALLTLRSPAGAR